MTQSEYDTQRGKLIAGMTPTESVSSGSASVKKRSIKEILQAIQALDAQARLLGLSVPVAATSSIGRFYMSGEGL
jgi:5-enolpyruvylshikimate-3-phosphate synthase